MSITITPTSAALTHGVATETVFTASGATGPVSWQGTWIAGRDLLAVVE